MTDASFHRGTLLPSTGPTRMRLGTLPIPTDPPSNHKTLLYEPQAQHASSTEKNGHPPSPLSQANFACTPASEHPPLPSNALGQQAQREREGLLAVSGNGVNVTGI